MYLFIYRICYLHLLVIMIANVYQYNDDIIDTIIIKQYHMGNIVSNYRNQPNALRLSRTQSQQQQQSMISNGNPAIETAYARWQKSNKNFQDLITYLEDRDEHETQDTKIERVKVFMSLITAREKIYAYLNQLQKYLIAYNADMSVMSKQSRQRKQKQRKVSQKCCRQLLSYIHPKLANIWFIWSQLANNSQIASGIIHEKLLPQWISNKNYTQKLCVLYKIWLSAQPIQSFGSMGSVRSPQAQHMDPISMVKQCIRINHPFLISEENLSKLFIAIMDEEVYIQDVSKFCLFIQAILSVQGTKQSRLIIDQYIQRVYGIISGNADQSNSDSSEVKKYLQMVGRQQQNGSSRQTIIYSQLLESSRKFLQKGYPHACQLIFQTILKFVEMMPPSEINLPSSFLQQYLYTHIYSLFIYSYNEINLQYKHLQKMTISNVIHLMLRGNQISNLDALAKIYQTIQHIEAKYEKKIMKQGMIADSKTNYSFQKQLVQYIFSNYCNLTTCLQILTTNSNITSVPSTVSIPSMLFSKLIQSKFQLVIQNQANIRIAVENYFKKQPVYAELHSKIQEILEIVRLMYMFGVNQKLGTVMLFYTNKVSAKSPSSSILHPQLLEQQRALFLYKTFLSKYLLSSSNSSTKKLLLSQTGSPIQVDISKPQAILQITQYLYDRLFTGALSSIRDLYQIMIQHLVYFYKYEDIRSIANNSTIMNKYGINMQMVEVIVVNNILQTIKKSTDITKILPDLQSQLKILKSSAQTVQIQSIKSLIRLLTTLAQHKIELPQKFKQKIDIDLLYWIIQTYPDRVQTINFDSLYEQIRSITETQIISQDEKFLMTNQLLKFKASLAQIAYKNGKKSLGNELIDQISRFNPPWLTTQLIKIFKNANTKIDKRIYGTAMKACSKGEDLQYLMWLWKEQQGKERRKEKGFADITQYFETGREYLVIDDFFIKDEQRYRDHVTQSRFNDPSINIKKYQLFFVLLGSQPDRAFHYALNVQLQPSKIQTFLREGMKKNIINSYNCLNYFHKYFYFVWKMQMQKLTIKQLPLYEQYKKIQFVDSNKVEQLNRILQGLKKQKQKSPMQEYYKKILSAYLCSLSINERFISTYFDSNPNASSSESNSNMNEQNQKPSLSYQLLFNQQSRKTMLIGLREQPMGRSDIILLHNVCANVLGVNLVDLCLFSVTNIANTSQSIEQNQNAYNILEKIGTLVVDVVQCHQIISRFIQKTFSIKILFQILSYFQSNFPSSAFSRILTPAHMKIIQSLSLVECHQQLHGMIPTQFFQKPVKYAPVWPISQQHLKTVRKCWAKNNIFVISKVMYFIYGMNTEVEKKIWAMFLEEKGDDDLVQIKKKLDNME